MLPFIFYLVKVMLCSAVLYAYYWLVLANTKFHPYNRFYLLTSVILSWTIPLFKIGFWENSNSSPKVVELLTIVANGNRYVDEAAGSNWFLENWTTIFLLAFAFVSAIIFVRILFILTRIWLLIKRNFIEKVNEVFLVFTNAKGTPFSFFKYIFLNDQISFDTVEGNHILKHELAHVREKHSVDKLFLNCILIAGWYNPFMWLIQKELNMIHEFIADEKAIEDGNTADFAAMILKTVFPQYTFPLANSFFYSPVKRRLLMLTSSKKTSFTYLRRLAVLPLLMITCVLFAFGFKVEKSHLRSHKSANTFSSIDTRTIATATENNLQDTSKKKKLTAVKESIEGTSEITIKDSDGSNITTEAAKTSIEWMDTSKVKKQLVLLDNKEITWSEFEKLQINPSNIISMTVLKGESAISKYGEKGKFDVIVIRTNENQEKQKDPEKALKYDKIFTKVENPPYYPKGMLGFAEYINGNMQYPKEAVQNKTEGAVLIQCIVTEEGKLIDFKKLSDKGNGLEEEAIRLLKNSGDWNPGIQNGHKVTGQTQQQIILQLPQNP